MHVGNYIKLVHRGEDELAKAFDDVRKHHEDEPDIIEECTLLASWSREHVRKLQPFIDRYGEEHDSEPEKLHQSLFQGPRSGGLGLVRDLHDLYLMATEAQISWTLLDQAAMGLRDQELETACKEMTKQTERQLAWLLTRIKMAAPQALIAAK